MSELVVRTDSLGGPPLARAAIGGHAAPGWYEPRPRTPGEWRARVDVVRGGFKAVDWLRAAAPALESRGAAAIRLERVRAGNGVLVTTGQQPGLFGGPIYTWSKAFSALALADEIERVTGVPTAPVFWAGTDDADFAEASWTAIAVRGGATRLVTGCVGPAGAPLSQVWYTNADAALDALMDACGATLDERPLAALRSAYDGHRTVGEAYVSLMRALLEPLGVSVLDASHPSVATASRPLLVHALERAAPAAAELRQRDAQIRAAGFEPQVAEVEGLSLVFERPAVGGEKRRIPIARGGRSASTIRADVILSPNVLLRPVIERALLPTVAYAAGPGELAYFAQVSAVAHVLDVPQPLAVPRWSGTIIEPHVARILDRLGLGVDDFADPHAAEGRLARASIPAEVTRAVETFRAEAVRAAEALRTAVRAADALVPETVVDGLRRSIELRLERFQRRITSAVKRREHEVMEQVATVRGALYPLGVRQERALNAIPLFARHGPLVAASMVEAARAHAAALVGGSPAPRAARGAGAVEDAADVRALREHGPVDAPAP